MNFPSGIWESVHNPDFNYGEFAIIKGQAGLNSYKISYIDKHGAIKRVEVMDLCHLHRNQAYRLLTRMIKAGQINQIAEQIYALFANGKGA